MTKPRNAKTVFSARLQSKIFTTWSVSIEFQSPTIDCSTMFQNLRPSESHGMNFAKTCARIPSDVGCPSPESLWCGNPVRWGSSVVKLCMPSLKTVLKHWGDWFEGIQVVRCAIWRRPALSVLAAVLGRRNSKFSFSKGNSEIETLWYPVPVPDPHWYSKNRTRFLAWYRYFDTLEQRSMQQLRHNFPSLSSSCLLSGLDTLKDGGMQDPVCLFLIFNDFYTCVICECICITVYCIPSWLCFLMEGSQLTWHDMTCFNCSPTAYWLLELVYVVMVGGHRYQHLIVLFFCL